MEIEDRLLEIIFQTKWAEAIGEWRKLDIDKLHKSCSSHNVLRVIT
jgi:hypothetical protein